MSRKWIKLALILTCLSPGCLWEIKGGYLSSSSPVEVDLSGFPPGVKVSPEPIRRYKRDFYMCRTRYFQIFFAPENKNTAVKAAGDVDRIYSRLSDWFGIDLKTPYKLFLLPDKPTIYRATGEMRDIGGAVTSKRGVLYVAAQYYNPRVLAHELTHIFLRRKLRDKPVPVWFNEGMAEYLSISDPTSDHVISFLKRKLNGRRLYRWRDLEKGMLREPEVTYPEALSAVVFLSARFGEEKLKKLLELYGARGYSRPFSGAISDLFGMSLSDLEKAWRRFISEGKGER